ncbi:hypothetical protein CBR_g12710 [Chara braunii]|uniref:Protein transport protein SEC23 n=1 Tax=Chara braunii TaxID=69332 RepID=A0A388KSE9_CHABU|nr:hypothetical protein CBR_g12710 [Chara braunii]|eukprot:GBG72991.1 hypothetical protein CBR_g12710 [Chara braunii]
MEDGSFYGLEAKDGVRLSWNVWPNSRVEATKCVIPFGALYTLVKPLPEMTVVPYDPVRCKSCRAVLNPFARVDYAGKIWICPFCFQRNHFPSHYASISETNRPAELFYPYTTIEYTMPMQSPTPPPPIFLFVVDTCVIEEELTNLRGALSQAFGLLPEHALVGLITYGTNVHVHEIGFAECPKAYVFRGTKEVAKGQIVDQLGLATPPAGGGNMRGHPHHPQMGGGGVGPGVIGGVRDGVPAANVRRFLLSVAECEFSFPSILDELQKDSFPVAADKRPARCAGTALNVAAGLLGACVPGTGARILLFVGGPSTEGPGAIVAKELSEAVRSQKDLDKDTAPFYHKAVKYYDGIAKQLVSQGHVVDLFACALDQVGMAEMKVCVERTGGLVVLAESFAHDVFKKSFMRIFEAGEHSLGLASNGIFEVIASRDIKVGGAVGPCASLERKGPQVAESMIGVGGTTAWKLCGLDHGTAVAVFFEIVPAASGQGSPGGPGNEQLYLQFLTHYQHATGQTRMRVTTIARHWVDGTTGMQDIMAGFDQEAAAVLMARLATHKMENEEEFNATRWLDRSLIRLSAKFGDYRKDDASSFNFSPNFSIYPQFMFNLRRSQFVQIGSNSPDETAYYRLVLVRESVYNSLVMIQPTVTSYSLGVPPEPALLDVASIVPDRVLVLDAFFSVVVFHGMRVAQWRNAGYQNQPGHEAFADLLKQPVEDAQAIIKERFPVPRYVNCDQYGSQARFLLAKLNPSATYNSTTGVPPDGDYIFTDDVSLQVFLDHLKRLAVQS